MRVARAPDCRDRAWRQTANPGGRAEATLGAHAAPSPVPFAAAP
jgi:hypothetical protein